MNRAICNPRLASIWSIVADERAEDLPWQPWRVDRILHRALNVNRSASAQLGSLKFVGKMGIPEGGEEKKEDRNAITEY
jgi:hypothetical protein